MSNLLRDPQYFRGSTLRCAFLLLLSSLLPRTLDSQAPAQQQPQPPSAASPGQDSHSEMAIKDQPANQTDEATRLLVNVRLVLARVVVRDVHGNAVGNLQKEDFEIFDNGKPQVISHFDVERSGALAAGVSAAPIASASPEAAKPAANPATVPSRYVAFLFDDVHLNFENINLVRAAAERRVDTLAPADRAAVFSTSGQTMLDFTDDRSMLHETIEKLRPRPIVPDSTRDCPDINLYMADLIVNKNDPETKQTAYDDYLLCSGLLNSPSPPTAALANAMSFVQADAMRVLATGQHENRVAIGVLKDVVRRISMMPGQRNLVLVSPGFLTPELEFDNEQVIDTALRAQVVISTLDARGLYVLVPYGDASQQGHADITPINIPGQNYTPASRSALDMQAASAQSDILQVLANSTGGNFFHNSNDMDEGFRRVADVPETAYVLGFAPQNLKLDGKFHSLKVSLKIREKYDVQARRGYYAPNHKEDPAEEAQRELEDEVHSSEELHGLPVELHTQFFKASDDTAKLTVLARVDVRRLHYKKADGRNQNNMTLIAALFDRNGNFLQASQKLIEMRWKDETLQGKLASGITLRSSFDVKPGRYMVRLVARDTEQQVMSAENGAVEIP